MRTKKNQISGCRDREEAVDPEMFEQEFFEKLSVANKSLAEDKRLKSEGPDAWECKGERAERGGSCGRRLLS